MTRRPMCLLCLFLMGFLCLADWLGFPLIRGNPLPESLQEWVNLQSEVSICGELETSQDTEYSQFIYLKQTYLIYNSKKYPIKNVKVILKEKSEVPAGAVLLLSGKLAEVQEPRNPGEFDSRQYYACRHIYYVMKQAKIRKVSLDYSRYGQFLEELKAHFAKVLKATSGEAAGVFTAVALGDKNVLEEETKLRYQMAGILHILAISGLHISILGVGLYNLLKKIGLGIWFSGMISLVIMLQYGMMTGGTVSTMRAVCMFLISVGAKILGRIYDMMTALAAAAILVLVESPAYLYDGGFLLSFSAVVGAGAVLPCMRKIVGKDRKASSVSPGKSRIQKLVDCAGDKILQGLLASVSVQLASLPVMLWFYGEVALAGIFLNLLVLPTVGIVLTSAVGAALGGSLWNVLGIAAGIPGRGILWIYEVLCVWIGKLPFCTWIGGRPQIWQIVAYYVILWLALLAGGKMRRCIDGVDVSPGGGMRRSVDGVDVSPGGGMRRSVDGVDMPPGGGVRRSMDTADVPPGGKMRRSKDAFDIPGRKASKRMSGKWYGREQGRFLKLALPVSFVLVVGLAICILGYRPGGELRITCLDVGQGDCSVVETPSGQVILIDGGSSNKSETGRYQILPYLKYRGISYVDAVFVSHTDADHINGIWQLLEWMGEGFTALRAGTLVLPQWDQPPEEWEGLKKLALKAGMRVETAKAGDTFRLGDGSVKVMSPEEHASGEDVNGEGAVLELTWESFRGIFTGDIDMETEKNILDRLEDVDFLKVAHHGSRYSSCEEFLERISAEIAVISCSATNTYGHPHEETLERLSKFGAKVLRTDELGAVVITVEGEKVIAEGTVGGEAGAEKEKKK